MGALLTWDGGSLSLDLVVQDSFKSSSQITEHPVETGANITDNVRNLNDELSLDFFVTNEPIGAYAELGTLGKPKLRPHPDATFGPIGLDTPSYHPPPNLFGLPIPNPGVLLGTATKLVTSLITTGKLPGSTDHTTQTTFQFFSPQDYVKAARAALLDLKNSVTLVDIFTPKAAYEGFLVQEISIVRTKEDGTGASFSVKFKHIRTVDVQTVAAPQPTELRSQPQVIVGKITPVVPPAPPTQQQTAFKAAMGAAFKKMGLLLPPSLP